MNIHGISKKGLVKENIQEKFKSDISIEKI